MSGSGYPPPRPGYHRDADPDGDFPAEYTPLGETTELTVTREYNFPLILTLLCLMMFGIPVSILLWAVALSWL